MEIAMMDYRLATLHDVSTLAAMNHDLIRDEVTGTG